MKYHPQFVQFVQFLQLLDMPTRASTLVVLVDMFTTYFLEVILYYGANEICSKLHAEEVRYDVIKAMYRSDLCFL